MCQLCKDADVVGQSKFPPVQLNQGGDGYRDFLYCTNCGLGRDTNLTMFINIPLGTKKKDIDKRILGCPHCGCTDCLV